MSAPGIVKSALGDEDVAANVSLSGGDELFVTPTRTLIYRAEGLLSDESVEAFDHDADRLAVSEGRRKSTITYEYAVDGTREFTVPTSRLRDVVQPILAGLLRARGVTDPDERVAQAYRFSELTLVITSERLIKHVGGAVWDDEYESYHFEDVTDLDYEEGSVATQLVLEVDGRRQRIKTPSDESAAVRQQLESALFAYHNVSSADELAPEPDEDDEDDGERVDATDAVVSMGDGIDPLSTGDEDALDEDHLRSPGTAGTATDAGTAEPVDQGQTDAGTRLTANETGTDAGRTEEGKAAGSASADAGTADPTGVEDDDGGSDDEAGEETDERTGDEAGEETADADAPVDPDETDEEVIDEWESPPEDGDGGSFGGGFEPANEAASPAVESELAELREAVERQNELLAQQQETIQQLVETLRQREASREEQ